MLKILARLEHKIGDRVFHLMCDQDAPIEDVRNALFHFSQHLATVETNAKNQAAIKQEEKPME